MITIDNAALETAKKKNGSFVVKLASASCGCAGGVRKNILIELLENFSNPNDSYTEYTYEGVNIYINKALIVKEDAIILQKANLPLIGPVFSSKNIELAY